MDHQSYTYHGDDGGLADRAAMLTSRNGDGGGDHEEDFRSAIKVVAACKAGGAFLDVGSGLGRIIEWLTPFAATLTGLEPDKKRFSACANGFAGRGIEILNTALSDYRTRNPGRRFDLITISMVIQHVSTGSCREILSDCRELMAPTGVAIISTTHFCEERFTYEADSSRHDAGEFDRYANNTENQEWGIPVRMFSKQALSREIETAGLELIDWRQFSYVRPEAIDGIASLYDVPADHIRDCALSQYAVVRRAGRRAPRRGLLSRFMGR